VATPKERFLREAGRFDSPSERVKGMSNLIDESSEFQEEGRTLQAFVSEVHDFHELGERSR
jgi:hypothetical protein